MLEARDRLLAALGTSAPAPKPPVYAPSGVGASASPDGRLRSTPIKFRENDAGPPSPPYAAHRHTATVEGNQTLDANPGRHSSRHTRACTGTARHGPAQFVSASWPPTSWAHELASLALPVA